MIENKNSCIASCIAIISQSQLRNTNWIEKSSQSALIMRESTVIVMHHFIKRQLVYTIFICFFFIHKIYLFILQLGEDDLLRNHKIVVLLAEWIECACWMLVFCFFTFTQKDDSDLNSHEKDDSDFFTSTKKDDKVRMGFRN